MTARPALSKTLQPEVFWDHYWLKLELLAFCRANGLCVGGSKLELSDRIAYFLSTGLTPSTSCKSKPRTRMPEQFDLESVIAPGWRCSAQLRSFLEQHLGPTFRFNALMRHFILERPGSTLGQAIEAYRADKINPKTTEIAPQFEYNRFTRDFRKTHPKATREELIQAWHEHRNTPKSQRD